MSIAEKIKAIINAIFEKLNDRYTKEETNELLAGKQDKDFVLTTAVDENGILTLTYKDDNFFTSEGLFDTVKSAYENGRNVYIEVDVSIVFGGGASGYWFIPLVGCGDEEIIFSVQLSDTVWEVHIKSDNTISYTSSWCGEKMVTDMIDDPMCRDVYPSVSAVYYYVSHELEVYTYSKDKTNELLENKADKATTLEGYGITDAYTQTETDEALERLQYYGNADIVPSDASLFTFTAVDINDVGKGASVIFKDLDAHAGDITIPYKCKIDGIEYIVTTLGICAFLNVVSLRTVVLPNTITSIEDGAFNGCANLININIMKGVANVGEDAFLAAETLIITCAEGSVADQYAQANGIAVEYTNEVTKAFVLEHGGKSNVITELSDSTLILEDKQDAQLGELSSLILGMPDEIITTYKSDLSFTSSGEGISLSYTDTPIIWRGDDCDSEGHFTPAAGTMYEISIKYVNTKAVTDDEGNTTEEPVIVARVGVV